MGSFLVSEVKRIAISEASILIKKQGAAKTFFKDIIKLITSQKDVLPIENIMLFLIFDDEPHYG